MRTPDFALFKIFVVCRFPLFWLFSSFGSIAAATKLNDGFGLDGMGGMDINGVDLCGVDLEALFEAVQQSQVQQSSPQDVAVDLDLMLVGDCLSRQQEVLPQQSMELDQLFAGFAGVPMPVLDFNEFLMFWYIS